MLLLLYNLLLVEAGGPRGWGGGDEGGLKGSSMSISRHSSSTPKERVLLSLVAGRLREVQRGATSQTKNTRLFFYRAEWVACSGARVVLVVVVSLLMATVCDAKRRPKEEAEKKNTNQNNQSQ